MRRLEGEKTTAEEERDSVQESYQRTLAEYKENNAHLITVIDELERKEQEVGSLKKKQVEKDRLMEQMQANSESVQEEAKARRREFGEKEREMLRELGEARRELREERVSKSQSGDKTKELTEEVRELKNTIERLALREEELS